MKIFKIFASLFKHNNVQKTKNAIPPCPIKLPYDPNNVTREEFRAFVQYLAKYKLPITFREPDRFITEAERAKKEEYRAFIRSLAETKDGRTFITIG